MTAPRLPDRDKETYIGDGLYASLDGYRVWLRAPRPEGDHHIALEPEVWRALRARPQFQGDVVIASG